MFEISSDELDILARIDDKEELRPFFFRKAKGLKWFNSLSERGYFNPDQNPKPLPSKEEGYINVPFWPAVEYLVSTSPELQFEENSEYAVKFIEIIRQVTKYSIAGEFSNYRTWWQFSKVIRNIPPSQIQYDDINLIDYWMSDPYERSLVAEEIGEKWLLDLLKIGDEHCKVLAGKLISIIYSLEFRNPTNERGRRKDVILRFRPWNAKKITKKIANEAGRVLGISVVRVLQDRLESILIETDSDKWSAVWRPAIDDHDQNHGTDHAEDTIIEAYRDSLLKYIESEPQGSREYLNELLSSPYETVRRVAVYAIDQQFIYLRNHVDCIITKQYFTSNFRHEMWNLLNRHYKDFGKEQQQRVLEVIDDQAEADEDEDEQPSEGQTAYSRAIWLSAIKSFDGDVAELYQKCVNIVGGEPEHPDFSSYMSGGIVDHKSPFSKEEMLSLEIPELIKQLDTYLATYQPSLGFTNPDLEGLVNMLRQVVKAEPLRFQNHLDKFTECDLAFVYPVIEAYRELWAEKAPLPWDEIWKNLLDFFLNLTKTVRFWSDLDAKKGNHFVANRHWIVAGIGRFIEAGTKSDEHAFSEKLLTQAEEIILILLEKEKGADFKNDSDAVSLAINSSRGQCIEALINITLRSCRLADKLYGNHVEVWMHFRSIYDAELRRSEIKEYEFSTLVVNYLPNFLYMSKEWVIDNLNSIFNLEDYQQWLCAMNGYAYVGIVYEEIYLYLKLKGHLIQALDDDNINSRVNDKIIQNIVIAYINDFESLEDESSMIHLLLARRQYQELSQLVWFVWTLRKDGEKNITIKVLELWRRLLEVINTSSREGGKIASKLCDWSAFVEYVNADNMKLLLAVAPFADEEYNSHAILESIARISAKQPFEAYEIWLELLKGTSHDFPEEAIRTSLVNLIRVGPDGLRKARHVVSEYLKGGNDRPDKLLREVTSIA